MNFHFKHLEINKLIIYSVLSPSSLDQHLSEVSASKLIAWTNSWIMNMATIGSGKPDLIFTEWWWWWWLVEGEQACCLVQRE